MLVRTPNLLTLHSIIMKLCRFVVVVVVGAICIAIFWQLWQVGPPGGGGVRLMPLVTVVAS